MLARQWPASVGDPRLGDVPTEEGVCVSHRVKGGWMDRDGREQRGGFGGVRVGAGPMDVLGSRAY